MLREVHHEFYRLIAARLDRTGPGPVVELGSGMGRIKEVIPDCLMTGLSPNPWLDRRENCYQLNFADSSVSHLIMFDVWHHLHYLGTAALREFHRVLAPGGRLDGWRIRELTPVASFNYFASGGFSDPQLGGRFLHGLMRSLDALCSPFPRAFAARRLVVLEKEQP